ncbi:MAG: flagellar basal body L-ring protein FlgH [Gammaproteobacteria bacterium]|nr:MAG: flagellar basal body L-ring protein FlgH [Gammaproteobacteria bacterium]
MNYQRLILVTAVVFLSACAQFIPPQPNDPYYAPVIPQHGSNVNMQAQTGAIYKVNNASFLYSDRTASRVGDLITINLNESTNATKNADTEIRKRDSNTMAEPLISGRIPSWNGNPISFDVDAERRFKAEADTAQANSLNGTITVTVAQVLPNGNLFIKGEKWLTLNQGNEFIRLSGIIRPEDISTENTISSTRVANARISYSGTGALQQSNEMGWLSQFFNTSWFPF